MVEDAIAVYEELKKNVYIVNRKQKEPIVIVFNNANFYHLMGFHKMDLDVYFPKTYSKKNKYEYIKKNKDKFNKIIEEKTRKRDKLRLRVSTFGYIRELLETKNTQLYNLSVSNGDSKYRGDYGLSNIFEDIYCLLGLTSSNSLNEYIPNSWMANDRKNIILSGRPVKAYENISIISIDEYNRSNNNI